MSGIETLSERGVAVIGAGTMGAGIAQRIAQESIPVFLVDLENALAVAGKDGIARMLGEAVERRIFRPEKVEQILSFVTPTARMEDLARVGLVIEAVFENEDVKRELFQKLNDVCLPDTIFASNTSSLSISRLGVDSGRPDRFGGLHFFFHPAKNRLLEVIGGTDTSGATLEYLWTFGRVIGKTCIKVADRAGFAVNRFFVPWLNEAARMVDEGAASIPTIEMASKKAFGIGMGPFELMNVTGVPIAYHSAASLERMLGPFYVPAESLREHTEMHRNWDLEGEPDPSDYEEVADRLQGCVFAVCARLVEEGVATREDTDRGAIVGLRWRRGPFTMMNQAGVPTALSRVERFVRRYPALGMPESLASLAKSEQSWTLTYVEHAVEDGVGRIMINRPEVLNALSPVAGRQLAEAFNVVNARPDVRSILIEGVGKAFVAGADLRFFVNALRDNDIGRVQTFTKNGHDLFRAIATTDKLTVAFVDGMAIGGGAELALACEKIVVGPKASFSFPETGIGIYPGLGGTQRLPRKIGKGLARYLILCGASLNAEAALACSLADASCTNADEAVDVALATGAPPTEANEAIDAALAIGAPRPLPSNDPNARGKIRSESLPGDLVSAEALFVDENMEDLLAGRRPVGVEDDPFIDRVLKMLSRKAPIALRLAADLIDKSSRCVLDEGLELELDHLESIFLTEDAMKGLTSVGKRHPKFTGK